MLGRHVEPGAAQPHPPFVNGQDHIGGGLYGSPRERDLDQPVQQRHEIFGPRHPHRIPQPAVGTVVAAGHHPDHHVIGPADRRPAHAGNQRGRLHAPERHLVVACGSPAPLSERVDMTEGMQRIFDLRHAGDE